MQLQETLTLVALFNPMNDLMLLKSTAIATTPKHGGFSLPRNSLRQCSAAWPV